MSTKRLGSAMVEFRTHDSAEMAVTYERGRMENPLTLEWIGAAPRSQRSSCGGSTTITDNDFESLVLRQLRQAEERKRLIAQMQSEEES